MGGAKGVGEERTERGRARKRGECAGGVFALAMRARECARVEQVRRKACVAATARAMCNSQTVPLAFSCTHLALSASVRLVLAVCAHCECNEQQMEQQRMFSFVWERVSVLLVAAWERRCACGCFVQK